MPDGCMNAPRSTVSCGEAGTRGRRLSLRRGARQPHWMFLNTGRVHQLRSTSRHNLPAPKSSFVGRERERLEVKRELEITRLLTLTGAGGSGKTRLALE